MIRIIIIFILTGATLLGYGQRQDNTNTVRGRVVESTTQIPISNITVEILDQNKKTKTDYKGYFEIEGISGGYHSAYVHGYGFKSIVSESFLVSSTSISKELLFEVDYVVNDLVNAESDPKMVDLDEISIQASALRSTIESPISIRRIGTEEIDLTPGANRDISKVVQLSAGVLPISFGNRNDVLVRGGDANENRYFLDGIEIPVLNHFAVQGGSGGYASLVNTELLSGVKFYTGAFPSEYINGVSSILDMQMKSGNSDKFHGKLIVGASDVGLNIDTPISKDGKTTLIASYRRSYLQLLFGVLNLPFLPTYNDYQFKISSKLTDRDEIYFIGLGSFDNNKLNLSIENPDYSQKYILGYLPNNNQTSYVFGVGYKHRFNGGEFLAVTSHNYLYNELYKSRDNDTSLDRVMDISSNTKEYKLRGEVKLYNLGGFTLKAGVGGGYGKMNSSTYQQIYSANHPQIVVYDNSTSVLRYSLYATLSREIIRGKLSSSVGLRTDGMSYSSKTSNPLKQLSPRFSISYKLDPKLSFSSSVGRYYQEPLYTTLSIEDNKSRLKYLGVDSYALGVNYSPTHDSKLKVEAFYKRYMNTAISLLDSLPVSTSDLEESVIGAVPAVSSGGGRSYGLEFTYRNLDLKNTIINTSYTLMKSELNRMDSELQPIKGEYWNSSWDVGHILNISAIHKFRRDWSFGAKWYLVGGLPYTPYDYDLSSNIDAWEARNRPYADRDYYNDSRSAAYHQLDLRVDKVWYFKSWSLGFYLDIQNVYNKSTRKQDLILPEVDSNGNNVIDPDRTGHYKMNTIESNYGGTILPTLGITIEI